MIFARGRCRTRYKISDDSLKGRVLKVRCRSCVARLSPSKIHRLSTQRSPPTPGSQPIGSSPLTGNSMAR